MKMPSESELRYYRSCYPSGTRVRLDKDMDDPQPIPAGTKGTILAIDDSGSVVVKWDNGRSLSLILGSTAQSRQAVFVRCCLKPLAGDRNVPCRRLFLFPAQKRRKGDV